MLDPQIAAKAPQAPIVASAKPAAAVTKPGVAGAIERLAETGAAGDVAHQHKNRHDGQIIGERRLVSGLAEQRECRLRVDQ